MPDPVAEHLFSLRARRHSVVRAADLFQRELTVEVSSDKTVPGESWLKKSMSKPQSKFSSVVTRGTNRKPNWLCFSAKSETV